MRKLIFIIIFISIFIFSSSVFVEAAFFSTSRGCYYKVANVATVEVGGLKSVHIRVGFWSLNKKTCSFCWIDVSRYQYPFAVYHNDLYIFVNPFRIGGHPVEPLIPVEGYHYPKCGWNAYNHYGEILVIVFIPSPPTIWPFCGETFDFKGDVYLVQEGQRYYLTSVSYTLTPRSGCKFRPSHVGGRGPGAKGSGATLESRGLGLGGGGLQGRGVTGFEIRYH